MIWLYCLIGEQESSREQRLLRDEIACLDKTIRTQAAREPDLWDIRDSFFFY